MTLMEAIRAFCQSDAVVKAAVGGARDADTPYTVWNPEQYNFPYATMTELDGGKPKKVFGLRGSAYLENVQIQFTFWDTGDRLGEARLRSNLDYFVQLINDTVLSLTHTTNMAVTLDGTPQVKFFPVDGKNNLTAQCWMGTAVFSFLQQRKVGTVE